jgi:hypothetical protein
VEALSQANLASQPLYMAATDEWDSASGFHPQAPAPLRVARQQYLQDAADRMAPSIAAAKASEPPAHDNLASHVKHHFEELLAAQSRTVRDRVNAKLGLVITGQQPSCWTVDFAAPGPPFVREGLLPGWNYKIEVEDKLISPFVTGEEPFFEDLLLSLRVQCSRRPDQYNEPLYHFLYEPDPERLHNWYANH